MCFARFALLMIHTIGKILKKKCFELNLLNLNFVKFVTFIYIIGAIILTLTV